MGSRVANGWQALLAQGSLCSGKLFALQKRTRYRIQLDVPVSTGPAVLLCSHDTIPSFMAF
jgi:hypothetical protein